MTIDWSDERMPALTGQGRYVDDIAPDGCLHVVFLRSPHASARITAIDTAAAAGCAGVRRIFIGSDLAGVAPIEARMDEADWYSYRKTSWPVIAVDEVRYVGEAVAAVVADHPYAAEDACALIEIAYEPTEAIVDARAGAAAGARRVHDGHDHNVLFSSRFKTEAADDPFQVAAHLVRGSFRHPRVAPAPIECCGAVARYDRREDMIELCTPTQAPHIIRDGLARCLGHPESHIRVTTPDVGGAFGVKMPLRRARSAGR
jgi:carbon-monoxide dehydrogenase large subunit